MHTHFRNIGSAFDGRTTVTTYRAALRSALSGAGALQEEVDQRQHKQAQAQAQTAFETVGYPGLHSEGCWLKTWSEAGALVTATEGACGLTVVAFDLDALATWRPSWTQWHPRT